jgi:ribosomal protein L11 methyltransferase
MSKVLGQSSDQTAAPSMVSEIVFDLREQDRPTQAEGEADEWLEWLSDELMALGALCVSVEDAQANDPSLEKPRFGEPGAQTDILAWPVSQIRILLDAQTPAPKWWDQVQAVFPFLAGCQSEIRGLPEEDWVSKSQRAFSPIEIDQLLWIGPSWHRMPPDYLRPPRIGLSIDPGMAFGTGGHATTRLCLQAILRLSQQRALGRVLDYGCGSGVLGLACAKLGAQSVIGVDIDPVAVDVARRNAELNLTSTEQQRVDWRTVSQPINGQFDLVIANILAQPLKLLAVLLLSHCKPGGGLVLSGILSRQVEELRQAYALAAPGRPLEILGEDEGWVCLGFESSP